MSIIPNMRLTSRRVGTAHRPGLAGIGGHSPPYMAGTALRSDLVGNAHPTTNRRGFTLVDMTVTLLLMGIMAAVAAPRFADALQFHRANSAAKRVAADLNLARKYAMTASAAQSVTFVVAGDSYSVTSGLKDLDKVTQPYAVTISDWPYQTQITSASFGGSQTIVFNGFGKPNDAGTVVVQAGNYQETIAVDAITGEATVQ